MPPRNNVQIAYVSARPCTYAPMHLHLHSCAGPAKTFVLDVLKPKHHLHKHATTHSLTHSLTHITGRGRRGGFRRQQFRGAELLHAQTMSEWVSVSVCECECVWESVCEWVWECVCECVSVWVSEWLSVWVHDTHIQYNNCESFPYTVSPSYKLITTIRLDIKLFITPDRGRPYLVINNQDYINTWLIHSLMIDPRKL